MFTYKGMGKRVVAKSADPRWTPNAGPEFWERDPDGDPMPGDEPAVMANPLVPAEQAPNVSGEGYSGDGPGPWRRPVGEGGET